MVDGAVGASIGGSMQTLFVRSLFAYIMAHMDI